MEGKSWNTVGDLFLGLGRGFFNRLPYFLQNCLNVSRVRADELIDVFEFFYFGRALLAGGFFQIGDDDFLHFEHGLHGVFVLHQLTHILGDDLPG